ncbi:MAG: crossover junction endodeoxyribonuclease RuvC [Flavobacteriales bacterium]|nr:crossover junction endodeoxyribonuclease RuvC [Flavobacteriales bacterium]
MDIPEKEYERVILGFDPGTNIMGYGVLGCNGSKTELVTLGIIHLSKLANHALKLQKIHERSLAIIDMYKPDEVALEEPFFGKNVQSMLKLGRAQGVAMAAALYRGIPIFEYGPKKIKQSITGNGNASKLQVASMLQNMLKFKDLPKYLDSTDAVAVALCHVFQSGNSLGGVKKQYSGWNAFIKENEKRLSNPKNKK